MEATGDYTVHGGMDAVDDGSDDGVFVMDMWVPTHQEYQKISYYMQTYTIPTSALTLEMI